MTVTRTKIKSGTSAAVPSSSMPTTSRLVAESSAATSSAVDSPPGASALPTGSAVSEAQSSAGVAQNGSQGLIKAALAVGDEVTVTWGEEKYQIRRFNPLSAGPFFYKTHVQPGETVAEAFDRAYAVVRSMGERCRKRKIDSFLQILNDYAGAEFPSVKEGFPQPPQSDA
jgi:hypothetical protein